MYNISSSGLGLLKSFETADIRRNLTAYQNKNDKPTIGYGLTYSYLWKRAVKLGDKYKNVSEAEQDLILFIKNELVNPLNKLFSEKNISLNQAQFDVIVSYCFNRGLATFKGTNLWKMIQENPNNPLIYEQFIFDWGTNQTYKSSLIKRRTKEALFYFGGVKPEIEIVDSVVINTKKVLNNRITHVILVVSFLALCWFGYKHKIHLRIYNFFIKKW